MTREELEFERWVNHPCSCPHPDATECSRISNNANYPADNPKDAVPCECDCHKNEHKMDEAA